MDMTNVEHYCNEYVHYNGRLREYEYSNYNPTFDYKVCYDEYCYYTWTFPGWVFTRTVPLPTLPHQRNTPYSASQVMGL